jgi:glycosyltransferase involved in cell wall biosynthesis
MYSLDVIVPFYNEESYLEESVNRLLSANIHNKIYLVDNNSTDSSSRIALNFSIKRDDVVYLETENKPGKGVGIRTAIENVLATHVVIHDADLEYFPEDIKEMFFLAKENKDSLILGSRFIGNKIRKNVYFRTNLANRVMSLFFSVVNFYYITDVATCYKLMPTTFFKEVTLKEKGFSIEVELLSKFLKNNKSILEVPIKYEGRSYTEGKKIKTSDGFKYLYNTLKYRFFN